MPLRIFPVNRMIVRLNAVFANPAFFVIQNDPDTVFLSDCLPE
jgi:hypothetical protein